MRNDSIETLLLRHYGASAPTPPQMEQRLIASVRRQSAEQQRLQRRISRRRAVGLVAFGSAGLGVLSLGLESLHMFEAALVGQDVRQQVATS